MLAYFLQVPGIHAVLMGCQTLAAIISIVSKPIPVLLSEQIFTPLQTEVLIKPIQLTAFNFTAVHKHNIKDKIDGNESAKYSSVLGLVIRMISELRGNVRIYIL